ncbi:MAG: hydrogenase expression protein HupH [Alphaproteobacteria bacterium]|nr:hydrogenase expression protein HupH [Alphaproteobacteria bacterium]
MPSKKKKALVIVPFALDAAGVANRRMQTKAVRLGPDIEFDFRPVTAGPTSFMSAHDWTLMDLAIFEAGLSAQEDGYDAVVIDTMSDSGMAPLRSMLDIPVLSPGRASMLFALQLGNRFGVLAQWEPAIVRYKKALQEYGLVNQCAAVEHFDTPPDFANLLVGKEDKVFPKMRAAAERAIAKGAEVICLGSTTMHQAAEYLAVNLPVPVINPGPLTYKLVEALLATDLTHSRHAYPKPLAPKPAMVRAMLKAAAAMERK